MRVIVVILIILIIVYVYFRKVWFYRDPRRKVKSTGKEIFSPADGQVIYIKKIKEGTVHSKKLGEWIDINEISKMELEKKNGWLIGIYMSPLDVHFNYAPIDWLVKDSVYTSSKFNLPMVDLWEYIKITYFRKTINLFSKKYRLINERNTFLFNGKAQIAVIEIADKFVSKITPFVEKGEKVIAGQKIGFIDRGSQVDTVIFEENIEILVKEGKQVFGAKTKIAQLK